MRTAEKGSADLRPVARHVTLTRLSMDVMQAQLRGRSRAPPRILRGVCYDRPSRTTNNRHTPGCFAARSCSGVAEFPGIVLFLLMSCGKPPKIRIEIYPTQ